MKQEPGRQQPGIPFLQGGEDVKDSDFRGELILSAWNRNTTGKAIHIEEGMRCAQLLFIPYVRANLVRVEKLDETERGEGGFGSTGS